MATHLIEIPSTLRLLLGEQDGDTRMFKAEGTQDEMCKWFDTMCDLDIDVMSPGGIAGYVGATRAGVHRRLKAGLMTAFCFSITKKTKTLFGGEKKLREFPIVYIPVEEARAWKVELEERWQRIQARKGAKEDEKFVEESCIPHSPRADDGSFFAKPPRKSKKRGAL